MVILAVSTRVPGELFSVCVAGGALAGLLLREWRGFRWRVV
jgi:hypothetical protein